MSMPVGGGFHQKAEMNVTPLIDVLLVLIIIFLLMLHQQEDDDENQQNINERRHVHFCLLMKASANRHRHFVVAPWPVGHCLCAESSFTSRRRSRDHSPWLSL